MLLLELCEIVHVLVHDDVQAVRLVVGRHVLRREDLRHDGGDSDDAVVWQPQRVIEWLWVCVGKQMVKGVKMGFCCI